MLPSTSDGNANDVDQISSHGARDEVANAPVSQASAITVASQFATKPLPDSDSAETMQPAATEHAQQELPPGASPLERVGTVSGGVSQNLEKIDD